MGCQDDCTAACRSVDRLKAENLNGGAIPRFPFNHQKGNNMQCPTVKIKADNDDGFSILNESDFDESKHELFAGDEGDSKPGDGNGGKKGKNKGKGDSKPAGEGEGEGGDGNGGTTPWK